MWNVAAFSTLYTQYSSCFFVFTWAYNVVAPDNNNKGMSYRTSPKLDANILNLVRTTET